MNSIFKEFLQHVNFDELYKVYLTLPTQAQKRQYLVEIFRHDEVLGQIYKAYQTTPTAQNKEFVQDEFNKLYIFLKHTKLS